MVEFTDSNHMKLDDMPLPLGPQPIPGISGDDAPLGLLIIVRAASRRLLSFAVCGELFRAVFPPTFWQGVEFGVKREALGVELLWRIRFRTTPISRVAV